MSENIQKLSKVFCYLTLIDNILNIANKNQMQMQWKYHCLNQKVCIMALNCLVKINIWLTHTWLNEYAYSTANQIKHHILAKKRFYLEIAVSQKAAWRPYILPRFS